MDSDTRGSLIPERNRIIKDVFYCLWDGDGIQAEPRRIRGHTAALYGRTILAFLSSAECLIYSGHTARSGFGTPGKLWLLLWKQQGCVCTHHDEQQDVLEAIPEAQSVGAEKGKISLQELQTKQRGF